MTVLYGVKLIYIYLLLKKTLHNLISLLIFGIFVTSCNSVKRVSDSDYLLKKTSISINNKKKNSIELNDLILEKKNNSFLGIPIGLHIYNLARPNKDSIFDNWLYKKPKRKSKLTKALSDKQLQQLQKSSVGFNNWLKSVGQAPALLDSMQIQKSVLNLERFYFSEGWFEREVNFTTTLIATKKAVVNYDITTGKPYKFDSISTTTKSPVVKDLLEIDQQPSKIVKGKQFNFKSLEAERERITNYLRNSGVYHFTQDYITFENDTIGKNRKVNVDIQIQNRIVRTEDSIVRVPFKTYTIQKVNVVTDENLTNKNKVFQDSIDYGNYTFYSYGKMKYRPKALLKAILINKGDLYNDIDRSATYKYLNDLKTFKYPNIEYLENNQESTLVTNIFLTPKEKFKLGFDFDVSQSNIQKVGFSFSSSLGVKNIFKGAETLEISALGAIGASKDGAGGNTRFFDINEIGADIKLGIPRLFFPVRTNKIIPKNMFPNTNISFGFTAQKNIGLDKQTFNGILNYGWRSKEYIRSSLDLFNVQYVRNLNPGNYFKVYRNSFNRLEAVALGAYDTPSELLGNNPNGTTYLIPERADDFIALVSSDNDFATSNSEDYQNVRNIRERKNRLIQNNLILASNYSFTKDSRENVFDNDFSIFRFKIEFAGNLLSMLSNVLNLNKNEQDQYEFSNVVFSQYAKTELDYIKLWDVGSKNTIAFRSFFGIALPYENSNSIPFSRSFFAGGSNDNRAWTAYNLGPGRSNNNNEFNEANMKIALSLEHRYNLFGNLNGAFFIDAGNIWNINYKNTEESSNFRSLKSLKDMAVGAGFGLRYDFDFFILRLDTGFKAYNPVEASKNRWFNNFNFSNAVYNIGINYPF